MKSLSEDRVFLLKIKNEALYFCFELESVVWLIVITSSPQFHLS